MNEVKYIITNTSGDILFKTYDGRYMFGHAKILPNIMFNSEEQAYNWINNNPEAYGNVPVVVTLFVRKKRNENGRV